MNEVCLISEKYIKENSIINDNMDTLYLLPAITFAQDIGLQPLIGTKLFNKLKELVVEASGENPTPIPTDYKVLIDSYIAPYLLNKVVADIQLNIAYKLRNQGVVQQSGENIHYPSLKDTQYFIQNYENKAIFYGNRLSDYLCANRSKYPEYCKTDSCADMHSNKKSYNTGIYLGRR